jgi:hypothetical protein
MSVILLTAANILKLKHGAATTTANKNTPNFRVFTIKPPSKLDYNKFNPQSPAAVPNHTYAQLKAYQIFSLINPNDKLFLEAENDGHIVVSKVPAPQKGTLEYLLKTINFK